jgi:hypothetical protein
MDIIKLYSQGFSLNITSLIVNSRPSTLKNIWHAASAINESSGYIFNDNFSEQISFRATSSYLNGDRSIKKMKYKMKYILHFLHLYKLFSPYDITLSIDLKSVIYAHTFTTKYFNDLHAFMKKKNGGNMPVINTPDMFSINGAWYIARDFRSNTLWERKCRKCHSLFVELENQSFCGCPYC